MHTRANIFSLIVKHPTHQNTQNEFCQHPFRSNLRHFGSAHDNSDIGTYSPLQAQCLQHPFKNWQEERRDKLTASTFHKALGFWPKRRVQLWKEKIGAEEPFSVNFATRWGVAKEKEALESYHDLTGNTVFTFRNFQVYGKDDWLGSSPDALVDTDGEVNPDVYGLPSCGVLEIKCPCIDKDRLKFYPWSRIPLYYIPQTQGLMEMLNVDWMHFYCWTLNGISLFRLRRNPAYWELMKSALSDFWWQHVMPARELYRKSSVTESLIELESFKPAPRHELWVEIVLASRYMVNDAELLKREVFPKKIENGRILGFPQSKRDQVQTAQLKSRDVRSHWVC